LEPTNEPYAVAKIAGIEICESYNRQYGTRFLAVMPTNLYGPGDNFDLETSHVLPALIRKFHQARIQAEQGNPVNPVLWGTGLPRREFLYVDDMADACIFLMQLADHDFEKLLCSLGNNHTGSLKYPLVNIGCGVDISIRDLAGLVAEIVGYSGTIDWDTSKPDGTPQKLLDISRIQGMGWKPQVDLEEGISRTYKWYLENQQTE